MFLRLLKRSNRCKFTFLVVLLYSLLLYNIWREFQLHKDYSVFPYSIQGHRFSTKIEIPTPPSDSTQDLHHSPTLVLSPSLSFSSRLLKIRNYINFLLPSSPPPSSPFSFSSSNHLYLSNTVLSPLDSKLTYAAVRVIHYHALLCLLVSFALHQPLINDMQSGMLQFFHHINLPYSFLSSFSIISGAVLSFFLPLLMLWNGGEKGDATRSPFSPPLYYIKIVSGAFLYSAVSIFLLMRLFALILRRKMIFLCIVVLMSFVLYSDLHSLLSLFARFDFPQVRLTRPLWHQILDPFFFSFYGVSSYLFDRVAVKNDWQVPSLFGYKYSQHLQFVLLQCLVIFILHAISYRVLISSKFLPVLRKTSKKQKVSLLSSPEQMNANNHLPHFLIHMENLKKDSIVLFLRDKQTEEMRQLEQLAEVREDIGLIAMEWGAEGLLSKRDPSQPDEIDYFLQELFSVPAEEIHQVRTLNEKSFSRSKIDTVEDLLSFARGLSLVEDNLIGENKRCLLKTAELFRIKNCLGMSVASLSPLQLRLTALAVSFLLFPLCLLTREPLKDICINQQHVISNVLHDVKQHALVVVESGNLHQNWMLGEKIFDVGNSFAYYSHYTDCYQQDLSQEWRVSCVVNDSIFDDYVAAEVENSRSNSIRTRPGMSHSAIKLYLDEIYASLGSRERVEVDVERGIVAVSISNTSFSRAQLASLFAVIKKYYHQNFVREIAVETVDVKKRKKHDVKIASKLSYSSFISDRETVYELANDRPNSLKNGHKNLEEGKMFESVKKFFYTSYLKTKYDSLEFYFLRIFAGGIECYYLIKNKRSQLALMFLFLFFTNYMIGEQIFVRDQELQASKFDLLSHRPVSWWKGETDCVSFPLPSLPVCISSADPALHQIIQERIVAGKIASSVEFFGIVSGYEGHFTTRVDSLKQENVHCFDSKVMKVKRAPNGALLVLEEEHDSQIGRGEESWRQEGKETTFTGEGGVEDIKHSQIANRHFSVQYRPPFRCMANYPVIPAMYVAQRVAAPISECGPMSVYDVVIREDAGEPIGGQGKRINEDGRGEKEVGGKKEGKGEGEIDEYKKLVKIDKEGGKFLMCIILITQLLIAANYLWRLFRCQTRQNFKKTLLLSSGQRVTWVILEFLTILLVGFALSFAFETALHIFSLSSPALSPISPVSPISSTSPYNYPDKFHNLFSHILYCSLYDMIVFVLCLTVVLLWREANPLVSLLFSLSLLSFRHGLINKYYSFAPFSIGDDDAKALKNVVTAQAKFLYNIRFSEFLSSFHSWRLDNFDIFDFASKNSFTIYSKKQKLMTLDEIWKIFLLRLGVFLTYFFLIQIAQYLFYSRPCYWVKPKMVNEGETGEEREEREREEREVKKIKKNRPLLCVKNLSQAIRQNVIHQAIYAPQVVSHEFNLQVEKGEKVLLHQKSDARATTLMETLVQEERIFYSGDIKYYSRPMCSSSKSHVSVIYHQNFLLPSLTVKQHIKLFIYYRCSYEDMGEVMEKAVSVFNLFGDLDAPVRNLSPIKKRYLSILLAFISSPKIILINNLSFEFDSEVEKSKIWSLMETLLSCKVSSHQNSTAAVFVENELNYVQQHFHLHQQYFFHRHRVQNAINDDYF